MKKTLLRAFVVLALVLVATVIFIFAISAEEEKTYKVRYFANGNVVEQYTDEVAAGGKHLIRTSKISSKPGKTFFGWYTDEGRFFAGGVAMQINVNSDVNLYEAYGTPVSTATDFKSNIVQPGPGNYIKLNANITIDETITLPSYGLVIIDLNNHKLTLNTAGNAFEGTGANIHIIDTSTNHLGRIEHNCTSTDAYITNALFSYAPTTLTSDVTLKVFPGYGSANASPIGITTNVGLFNVQTDVSNSGKTFHFDLSTNLSASYLVHSSGMRNATLDVDSVTKMDLSGARIFEDRGTNDGKVLTFNLDAGQYTIGTKTIFTNEQSRYNLYLTGGSFNRDIKALFENGNYSFKLNSATSKYDFLACAHNDDIINISATCTEAGTITTKCRYCSAVRETATAALGHSTTKSLTKEANYGSEKTDAAPGEYTVSCARCDYKAIELYYPSAKDVYVKVGLSDGTVLRVQSTLLYGNGVDKKLTSYTPSAIEGLYGIKREEIISVEIPLGIETIAGSDGIDGAKIGVFYQNEFLEEIILPQSIQTVQKYAFSEMPKLKRVIGLEYISDTIDKEAFKQTENSVFDMDHIVLNAKTIGENSFRNVRMKTLTFGKGVETIVNNAFALDQALTTKLVEIFVEENTTLNRAKLSEITGAFKSIGSGHQFGSNNIVFVDHDYTTETVAPTCKEQGYDNNYCKRCGESSIDNYVDPVPHDFSIEITIESSCAVRQGEVLNKCSTCDETKHVKWLEPAPHNHVFEGAKGYFTNKYVQITDICTQDYLILDVCACGKTFDKTSVFANGGPQKATGEHDLDYANPIKTVDPTCSTDGYQDLMCKICKHEERIVLESTAQHDFVRGEEVPSTCTVKGEIPYICSVCGAKRTPTTSLPLNPDNHTWDGNWVQTIAPTTQSVGQKQQTCTGCGKKDIQHIPVLVEQAEKQSKTWIIVGGIVGGIVVLGLTGVLLYYTLFKKNPARKHKYNFDSYSTRRD